jgi:ABC-type uncharacterized transport system ATPase subunit
VGSRFRSRAIVLTLIPLEEILELADGVMVMFEAKRVYETPGGAADPDAIGAYMAGH